MIDSHCQILFWWSNQRAWNGLGM